MKNELFHTPCDIFPEDELTVVAHVSGRGVVVAVNDDTENDGSAAVVVPNEKWAAFIRAEAIRLGIIEEIELRRPTDDN